jgi:hypothetical protein
VSYSCFFVTNLLCLPIYAGTTSVTSVRAITKRIKIVSPGMLVLIDYLASKLVWQILKECTNMQLYLLAVKGRTT